MALKPTLAEEPLSQLEPRKILLIRLRAIGDVGVKRVQLASQVEEVRCDGRCLAVKRVLVVSLLRAQGCGRRLGSRVGVPAAAAGCD